MAVVDELVKIAKRYELLKRKYLHKGVINKELHKKNNELQSENICLRAMICEKFEISQDILSLNIKLYRKEQQMKAKNAICRYFKDKTKGDRI